METVLAEDCVPVETGSNTLMTMDGESIEIPAPSETVAKILSKN